MSPPGIWKLIYKKILISNTALQEYQLKTHMGWFSGSCLYIMCHCSISSHLSHPASRLHLFLFHEQINSHNQRVLAGSNYAVRKPLPLYNQGVKVRRFINDKLKTATSDLMRITLGKHLYFTLIRVYRDQCMRAIFF